MVSHLKGPKASKCLGLEERLGALSDRECYSIFDTLCSRPGRTLNGKISEASKRLEYSGQISHGLLAMPRGSHQFIDPGSDELQVLVPCRAKTLNPKPSDLLEFDVPPVVFNPRPEPRR